jgi:N-acetylneuraminic acid mutarotase
VNSRAQARRARRRIIVMLALIVVVAGVIVVLAGHLSSDAGTTSTRTTSSATAHLVGTTRPRVPRRLKLAFASAPVGRWVTESEAPTPRGEVSAALVGNFVYVVGGFDAAGRSSPAVERLNLVTGRWRDAPPMPEALNHMSAVAYGGDLYVVGGYSQPGDTSTGAVRDFWRFRPASGKWSAMPAAPLSRAAAGAAVLGHRLYVAGGRSDTLTTISTLAIFDFQTGRWSLGPSLHQAREHVAAAAADRAVWLMGGRALGQGNFTDVERYRPGAASWERMAPMPVARSGFQAVNAAGKIVVVGGEGPAGTIAEVDQLDPVTGRWSRLPDLPTPRHGLGLVAAGPLVLAIDGGPEPGLTTSRVVQVLRAS